MGLFADAGSRYVADLYAAYVDPNTRYDNDDRLNSGCDLVRTYVNSNKGKTER